MSNAAGSAIYEILTLSKNEKIISLEDKTTSFDYYESLLSPNITATMTFVDTGDMVSYSNEYDRQERPGTLYNALPITSDGSEEIRFKIKNDLGTLDFSRTPLYINGSIPDQGSQKETVILNLVSKSGIVNQETHVTKNYSKSSSNANSVRSILKDVMGFGDDSKLLIEETSNNYPFIGNYRSPFEIIMMLASKSVPNKINSNPGFFFFETKDGHRFRSIDSLIDQKVSAEYYKNEVNKSSATGRDNNFKISYFNVIKNQNLIQALKSGVYSNRTVFFNPLNFKEEEIPFTVGKLPSSLGKNEVTKPKNEKYTRIIYDIFDVGAIAPTINPKNSISNPKEWQGKVQMRYNLLFSQVIRMQVPCNPNLRAGDVIKCYLEIITQGSKEIGSADPVESGKYLILDLCHHYDTENSFTSMTLVRDTYGLYTNKK